MSSLNKPRLVPESNPFLPDAGQSGIVIWSFDRLARLGRHIVLNRMWLLPVSRRRLTSGLNEAQLEVVGDECMRLTIKRPLMKWSAGQHA